jgi:hypothetical protein
VSDNYDDDCGNGRHKHTAFAGALKDTGSMYWEVFNEIVYK